MKIETIKKEVFSGLTISLALVPEAISFALIVGVAPTHGLWAAVIMALSTALFGGRPGLISGATGATAVIMAGLVAGHGEELLYLGVIMAGVIQFILWATGGWKIFNLIPKPVMSGFLISLAILILMGQVRYLSVGEPSGVKIVLIIATSIVSAWAMWFSSKLFTFPPALAAIGVGLALGIPLGLATVGDLSEITTALPTFTFPQISLGAILTVLPYSLGMAIAGLTESLLTVETVSDKLGEEGSKGRETLAQAVGNMVSGLFTTIGGCVLVGQTNLNIMSGAKRRLSAITAGLGLVLIILIFSKWIALIPLAGLIGVMLIVAVETGDWRALYRVKGQPLASLLVTIIVSLATHNLAFGVIAGTLLDLSLQYRRIN
jgi:SulP family sulfate permease